MICLLARSRLRRFERPASRLHSTLPAKGGLGRLTDLLLTGRQLMGRHSTSKCREAQIVAIQPRLHRLAGELRRQGLEYAKYARDRDELGAELLTEHPRAGFAPCSRHCPP